MHIYNVTTNIDERIHDEWIEWMKTTHIPQMLATGKFTKATMSRVLVDEEMGGITYSVQYQTKSMEQLQAFYKDHLQELERQKERFKGQIVFFSTEMEIIHEG